ncbi:protein of unknown function [Lactiplantibacillus plantarum]
MGRHHCSTHFSRLRIKGRYYVKVNQTTVGMGTSVDSDSQRGVELQCSGTRDQ